MYSSRLQGLTQGYKTWDWSWALRHRCLPNCRQGSHCDWPVGALMCVLTICRHRCHPGSAHPETSVHAAVSCARTLSGLRPYSNAVSLHPVPGAQNMLPTSASSICLEWRQLMLYKPTKKQDRKRAYHPHLHPSAHMPTVSSKHQVAGKTSHGILN